MNQSEAIHRIVIVGGVAGGASAAARARRCHANAEITIFEKGKDVSFANCGLPYHLGGEIEERSKLLVATPELFWNRFRVRVRTEHEVTVIDRHKREIRGRTIQGEEFVAPYDRLILATGSMPAQPAVFETSAENVFQLWTLQDMDRIMAYMQQRPCKKAVVVGAGYVGLEVVEQLKRRDIHVTLIERLPQVLAPLDTEMAKLVELELVEKGIAVRTATEVTSLLTSGQKVTAVRVTGDETLAVDMVIASIGVRPRIALAEAAGLLLGDTGGVGINEFCQTNDPHIYAVGDIAEYYHGTLDQKMRVPLAGPANRSGRVAGSHVAGKPSSAPMPSVQGTSIVRAFGLAAGSTGMNERQCKAAGLDYRAAIIQAPHHASYFPGARNLTLKLLYESGNGRLLGAQAVGAEGVDKRLDVVATVLHFSGTVHDLAGLDLSYAPPFGSAKDPLHMAAFVAENDLAATPRLTTFDAELAEFQVLDVRNAAELRQLPLAGASHIPLDELAERWQELDPDKPTVTVCHSGKRAHVAACWLQGKGFRSVSNLSGGMSIRRLTQS
jgi:NADPH-dependent 2,4-dienoyl-CoA reductase/sulfur reductase-like enzyme/rhodanese-related sulfurtransferase